MLLTLASIPGYAQFQLSKAQQSWVDQTLMHMTLEEKIGQVMFGVVPGVFTNQESEAFQKIKENIQTYHVGGDITSRAEIPRRPRCSSAACNNLLRIRS